MSNAEWRDFFDEYCGYGDTVEDFNNGKCRAKKGIENCGYGYEKCWFKSEKYKKAISKKELQQLLFSSKQTKNIDKERDKPERK